MLNHSVTRGVCAACKYERGCIYKGDSGRMILQCEQFEMEFPVAVAAPNRLTGSRASSGKENDPKTSAGLCSSCRNREGCTYLRPEGGVWHCDEYA